MILLSVKNVREISPNETIIIPPQCVELYHITDSVYYKTTWKDNKSDYSLVTSFLKGHNIRVIKRIVVTNKFIDSNNTTLDDDVESSESTSSKVVTSTLVSTQIQKSLLKLRSTGKLRGVGLISTITQNSTRNTTLFDLSSLIYRLSQRTPSFFNKTSSILETNANMIKTKGTTKILVITTNPYCYKNTSFLRALVRDYIINRLNHSVSTLYDFVIINLVDEKNELIYSVCLTKRYINFLPKIYFKIVNISKNYLSKENENEDELKKTEEEVIKNISKTSNLDHKESEEIAKNEVVKKIISSEIKKHASVIQDMGEEEKKNVAAVLTAKTISQIALLDKKKQEDIHSQLVTGDANLRADQEKVLVDEKKEDEVIETSDDVVRDIFSEIKEKVSKISVDKETIKTYTKIISSIVPETKKLPKKITATNSITNLITKKKDKVSNIFNSHTKLYDMIETYIDLYNKTYWNKLGFRVKIKDLVRNQHKDPLDLESYDILYIETIFEGKKIEHSIYLPVINKDGVFWVNGVPRILQAQIYPLPIINKQNECLLRTTTTVFTVSLITKNKTTYYESKYYSKQIPTLLILLVLKEDLQKVMQDCGIKNCFIVNEKDISKYTNEYTKIKYSKENYLVIQTSKMYKHQTYIISTFRIITKLYDTNKISSTTNNFWLNIASIIYDYKTAMNIKFIDQIMLDPITRTLLFYLKYPYEMYELIITMMSMSMDATAYEENDIETKRIRKEEIIPTLLFKNITSYILSYITKTTKTSKIPPMSVITDLLIGDSSTQFQLVQHDFNPLYYSVSKSTVTYKGLDSIKNITKEYRNIHPNMRCIIDPIDTSDNNTVGESQRLVISSNIGKFGSFEKDKDCNTMSIATSMIPLSRHTDTLRVQMAVSQIKQALPLANVERPLLSTGYEPLVATTTSNIFVTTSDVNGTVTESNDEVIIVRDDKDKTDYIYKLVDYYTTNTKIKQQPTVSVGEKVSPGTIIAEDKNFFKNGFYSYGVNAKVAYMNYFGYSIEDGVVISESFAKKLTSIHSTKDKDSFVVVPHNTRIVYIKKVNETVTAGEPIIIIESKENPFKRIGTTKLKDLNYIISYEEKKVVVKILSSINGTISDIEVYPSKNGIQDQLKDLYEQYIKKHSLFVNNKKNIVKSTNPLSSIVDSGMYSSEEDDILIYRITYSSELTYGDKISNRHGHKGIVSLIVPDEKMPRDDEGVFDVLINPCGILGRKNIGQLLELWLSECICKLEKIVKQYVNEGKYESAIDEILNFYAMLLDDKKELSFLTKNLKQNYKELLNDFIKHGFTIPFDINQRLSIDRLKNIMNTMKIQGQKNVYIPELGYYTRTKVNVGRLYIFKLQQRAETKTRGRSISKYTYITLQPQEGRAKEGGAKVGEYDLYSLISHNASNTIKELYSSLSDDHKSKQEVIKSIVEKGKVSFKDIKPISLASKVVSMYILGLHNIEI